VGIQFFKPNKYIQNQNQKFTTDFLRIWSKKINSRRGAAGRAGAWLERAAGAAGRQ
jgi:hypothetical protein